MGAKERLRAYLKLKGISQTYFLNSIGASPGYIAAMSKGNVHHHQQITPEGNGHHDRIALRASIS